MSSRLRWVQLRKAMAATLPRGQAQRVVRSSCSAMGDSRLRAPTYRNEYQRRKLVPRPLGLQPPSVPQSRHFPVFYEPRNTEAGNNLPRITCC
jgi:hypothetical protein